MDSESLRAIRDSAHDPNIRTWIQGFYDRNEVFGADAVAQALAHLLEKDQFPSGSVHDAVEAMK